MFLCVFRAVCAGVFVWVAVCTTEESGKRTCQQRPKVLITYRSNLADDSLKMRRAVRCVAQKEREETIYCSKVPWTPIPASLNVYHQFLASEPCLAALLTASLSLPRYLTPLFSLFYSRSTLSASIPPFTSHLCPLTYHFFSVQCSLLSAGSLVHHCSSCRRVCALNISVLFSSLLPHFFSSVVSVYVFLPPSVPH